MGSIDHKFVGWLGLDKSAAEGHMVWKEFEPKPWEENDIDIKISHCGSKILLLFSLFFKHQQLT